MFPIKDTIRSRSFPLVTWLLIAINILVFIFQTSLPQAQLMQFIDQFAVIPVNIHWLNPFTWLPLVTSMFLHGGWFHLLSNMWALFIFGDNVEDRLGSGRFLGFYLLSGLAAIFLEVGLMHGNQTPILGASGAIAGVLGAYFFFFPTARVITFVPIFIIPWFIEIPALIYLGFWFVSQLFSGLASFSTGGAIEGIAWWAHIGGFLFGIVAAIYYRNRRRSARWHADEYYPW